MPEGTPAQPDLVARPSTRARRIRVRRAQCLVGYTFGEPSLWRIDLGWVRLGGTAGLLATAGDRLAIPQGTTLDLELLPDVEAHELRASVLSFDAGAVREAALAGVAKSPMILSSKPALDAALNALLETSVAARPVTPPAERLKLTALLTALREAGSGPLVSDEALAAERVRAVLLAAPGRRWRTAEVARQLALSPATLRRRLVESATGFRALHEELRLSLAVELLQAGELGIQQVADACGYSAASRFAAAFRRRYGCAPSELRD